MRDFLQPGRAVETAVLERPQLRGERARRWLQQRGNIEVIGAETDADLAQGAAAFLRQALHVARDFRAIHDAEVFRDPESDPA